MSTPVISVVVPVFRSAPLLEALVQRLRGALDAQGRPWEVIMVDDASPDDSYTVMQRLRAADPRVRIVQLARNHGQQAAVLCGLNYARGAEVDADALVGAVVDDALVGAVVGAVADAGRGSEGRSWQAARSAARTK